MSNSTIQVYDLIVTATNESTTVYGWVNAKCTAIGVSYHNGVTVDVVDHFTGEVVATYHWGVRA